jgi:hypothetical protein
VGKKKEKEKKNIKQKKPKNNNKNIGKASLLSLHVLEHYLISFNFVLINFILTHTTF